MYISSVLQLAYIRLMTIVLKSVSMHDMYK